MVHSKFVPPGQTVNVKLYVKILKRLKPAFLICDYLTQIGVATVLQLPYRPDLATPDFCLFPKLKKSLKGHHLDTTDNIKMTLTRLLKDILVDTGGS